MTVQVVVLKDGSACFATPKFIQVVTRLAPKRVLVTGIGYSDGTVVPFTLRELDKELALGGPVSIFSNLLEESGNSSVAREAWATWARERRSQLESTHILFRSRLMEMGISIVSMLVGGGAIKTYADVRQFQRKITEYVPNFTVLPVFPDLPRLK